MRQSFALALSLLMACGSGCTVTVGNARAPAVRPTAEPMQFITETQWNSQVSGVKVDLQALSVIDAERAYVGGDDGTLLKTIDGGTTWKAIGSAEMKDQHFQSLHFSDALKGWALSEAKIFHTTNGGLDWTLQADFASLKVFGIKAVKFATPGTGYVLANDHVLCTTDGGLTWVAEKVADNEKLQELAVVGTDVWVAGTGLYKRSAPGRWRKQFSQANLAPNRGGLSFVSPQEGWLLRQGATDICHTVDGGKTWVPAPLHKADGGLVTMNLVREHTQPYRLSFADAKRGWILAGIYAIATADGGRTWAVEPGGIGVENVRALQMTDRNYGWVVGLQGIITRRIGLQL